MTDAEFYQDNLIKCLEGIKKKIYNYVCNKEENTAKAQGMLNAVGIVDKYIDKAKRIKEIQNGFN